MEGKTTIVVRRITRDALAELGKKGETFDEIIWRLIQVAKNRKL